MSLFYERIYPYLFMLLAAGLWYYLKPVLPSDTALLSSTLSVSGVLVGFMSTSKSILMTMNSRAIRNLKKSGYMDILASYMSQAVWLNLLFCTINILGFFSISEHLYYPLFWVAFAAGAFTSFFRITQVMILILKSDY